MGAERGHPSADFFAKVTVTNRKRAGDLHGLDGAGLDRLDLDGLVSTGGLLPRSQRNWFNPAFRTRRGRPRYLPGDGLNECHGLRDQKVALFFPLHCAPQPAGISAKSPRSIKLRLCRKAPNWKAIERADRSVDTIQTCDSPAPRTEVASSQDSRRLVAPVTVAQQPLVELAGRQPRQFGLKVDRARHLLARQRLAAEKDQLLGEIRPRQDPGHRLHHRFHFLAKIGDWGRRTPRRPRSWDG